MLTSILQRHGLKPKRDVKGADMEDEYINDIEDEEYQDFVVSVKKWPQTIPYQVSRGIRRSKVMYKKYVCIKFSGHFA